MINVPWLPVRPEDPKCGHRKKKKSKVSCELPPDHKREYVGGVFYPLHQGRDRAMRWHTW